MRYLAGGSPSPNISAQLSSTCVGSPCHAALCHIGNVESQSLILKLTRTWRVVSTSPEPSRKTHSEQLQRTPLHYPEEILPNFLQTSVNPSSYYNGASLYTPLLARFLVVLAAPSLVADTMLTPLMVFFLPSFTKAHALTEESFL